MPSQHHCTEDAPPSLTYAELEERAEAVASALRAVRLPSLDRTLQKPTPKVDDANNLSPP